MGLPDVGSRPMPDKSRRTSAVLELQMSGNGVYQDLSPRTFSVSGWRKLICRYPEWFKTMPNQAKCKNCDPPGSGHWKSCKATAEHGKANCRICYGTGKCRYCNGTGLEMSTLEKATDILVGLWWISWFGIIGGFLMVGVWVYRNISPPGSALRLFCLALLIVTILMWGVFYAVEEKARAKVDGVRNDQVVVHLLTMTGTFLAIISLMEILFFIY